MCGIIGIIGKAPVTPLLVEALKRLEYRGYDSAGVATLVNGHIERRRPPLLCLLPRPAEGHRVGRHVGGDDAARRDVGAAPDSDRGHQRTV